jgi:hypothetical protein
VIHRFASLATLLVTASSLAAPIPVTNQGFESPVQVANGFTTEGPPGTTPGWTILSGTGGVFYPTVASWGYVAPFGHQVLYCNGATFEQTVAANIVANRTYTLRVSIVNRPSFGSPNYNVQLLASATVVASDTATVVPPVGGALDTVLTYTAPALGPTIGQPIRIRLSGPSQVNFDNVRLEDSVPVACPGDVNGDGDTTISDFNIVAGNFGTGPGKTRAQGDLSGDGFVNIADFNIVAGNFGCNG